jgi:hypothetical protein
VRANQLGTRFKALNGVLKVAVSDGGGADDERAIGDGLGNGGEFLCGGKDIGRRTYGGASALKSYIVWVNDAQVEEAEIAHGAGRCADIQGIASVDKDHAQAIEFKRRRQAFILRQVWMERAWR